MGKIYTLPIFAQEAKPIINGSRLAELVAEYNLKVKPKADEEYRHFQNKSSLGEAIRYATYAIKANGKRHSHQRWIKTQAMECVRKELMAYQPHLPNCRDFEELHKIVWECAVSGFAVLSVYDTATRLGAYLGIRPDYVYLHRGTTVGAAALGLDVSREFICMKEFPEEMQCLQPDDAENFLCIYKDELSTGQSTSRSKCLPTRTKCIR